MKWGYGLVAVLATVLGILLLVFNNNMMSGLAIAIGVTVILAAAVLTVLSISSKSRVVLFTVKSIVSGAMLVAGVVMLVMRESVMETIISVFGLILLLDGAFKLYETATSGEAKNAFWWIRIGITVLMIAGGYLTVHWSGADFAVFVLGIGFILDAIANCFSMLLNRNEDE